jgi:hypothetical protein
LSATQTCKKNAGQCYIHRPLCFGGCSTASHQPQSERLKADFIDLFRFASRSVAVTRSQPYTTEKVALGLWWLSVTATPPPSHKKTKKNGFFAPLGCLELHEINTNALRLFAHFFRRKPKGFIFKKRLFRSGFLLKKSSA